MGPIISRIKRRGSSPKAKSRHSSRQHGRSKSHSKRKRATRCGQSPARTYSPRPRNAHRNRPNSRGSSLSSSVNDSGNSALGHKLHRSRRRVSKGSPEVGSSKRGGNQRNRDRKQGSHELVIRTRSPLPKGNDLRERETPLHESGRTPTQEKIGPRRRTSRSGHRTGMHKRNRPHYQSSNLWTDQRKPPSPPHEAPAWTYKAKEKGVLPVLQLPKQYTKNNGALGERAENQSKVHAKDELIWPNKNYNNDEEVEQARKEAAARHNQALRAAAWNNQPSSSPPQEFPQLKPQIPIPQPLTTANLREINAQHALDNPIPLLQQTVATMTAISDSDQEESFIGAGARTYIEGMVPRSQASEIFKLQREEVERRERERRRMEMEMKSPWGGGWR